MKQEILQFHYEELIYILMILSSDLKKYKEEELIIFAEAITRLETLSDIKFLKKLKLINPNFNEEIIKKVINLKKILSEIYTGQWYKKLKNNNIINKAFAVSKKILEELKEEYVEPIEYSRKNMEVKWT